MNPLNFPARRKHSCSYWKEGEETCMASAKMPALLLKTSILGCAFLTASARLLTCFMEERSAAKLCTLPFPVVFLILSAAAPALLLFLQKAYCQTRACIQLGEDLRTACQ